MTTLGATLATSACGDAAPSPADGVGGEPSTMSNGETAGTSEASGAAGAGTSGASGAGAGEGAGGSGAPAPAQAPAHERASCDVTAAITFCGGAGCHYATTTPEFGSTLLLYDLANMQIIEDAAERLINVPATYNNVASPAKCPDEPELLIDPTNVEESLILKKLEGTHTCGDDMPRFPYPEWGTVTVPGDQREELVACIREWVMLLVEDYTNAQ